MPNHTTSIKKRMLLVLLGVAILLALLILLINILTRCTSDPSDSPDGSTPPAQEIEFSDEYVTDASIFYNDERYLDCNRTIYFCDPQTGVTEGIEDGNYADYGAAAELLCNVLNTIIAGDAEAYNEYFSEIYYESNEEKAPFSMQKLYDILITEYSKSEETSENGGTYKKYIYEVGYRIRNNNGSYRSDVGSDQLRMQYFLITNRGGSLQIDAIYTYGENR